MADIIVYTQSKGEDDNNREEMEKEQQDTLWEHTKSKDKNKWHTYDHA
jgi:hypothetical protein